MTGKRRLMARLLADAADGRAAVVTTKLGADRIRATLAEHGISDGWEVTVVDAVTRQHGFERARDTATVEYVATPGDLTGIGISVSGFMQDAYHDPSVDTAAVGLHSLSTLLMYADFRRVYQFTHVVTSRVTFSDFVGAFSLDVTGGTDESYARLTELFDGLVEVRDDDDVPELRTRGAVDGPRRWTPYSPR
jgi:hypothetical protein